MPFRFPWFAALLAISALTLGASYEYATESRRFQFPRDHASHPEYRVEWWYYTGNVSAGRREFGYQLTFFRVGIDPAWRASESAWAPHDVLFAHWALSDASGPRFRFHEQIARPALGMAGADTAAYRVWIDDWSAALAPDERTHRLHARAEDMALDLALVPEKPPVIHGADGLSHKSAVRGNASHYYSLSRLATTGWIRAGAESLNVSGESWMDHEFSTSQLDSSQVGWDWLSLQLDSDEELMLYQLRRRDGSIEPLSSGHLGRERWARSIPAALGVRHRAHGPVEELGVGRGVSPRLEGARSQSRRGSHGDAAARRSGAAISNHGRGDLLGRCGADRGDTPWCAGEREGLRRAHGLCGARARPVIASRRTYPWENAPGVTPSLSRSPEASNLPASRTRATQLCP
jgi:predicted secreted hydrolase